MSLPKIPPPRSTVEVNGELVEIRGLTRAEAARCQKMVEQGAAWADLEIAVVGYGTDTPTDDVAAWYEATDGHAVEALVDAIKTLSRLDEGASKSGGAGDSPGG